MQQLYTLFPSRYLAMLLGVAHVAALVAIAGLPIPAQLALAGLLLCNLFYHLRRNAWLTLPSALVAFRLEGDGVVLSFRSGKQQAGKLLGSSVVMPFLTVMNVLPEGAHLARSVLLLPDSLEPDSLRQLRVELRWRR